MVVCSTLLAHMDTAIPIRSLIEEPTVETGILALPKLEFPEAGVDQLTLPSWIVALVLLTLVVLGPVFYYARWPWNARSKTALSLLDAIDTDPALHPSARNTTRL